MSNLFAIILLSKMIQINKYLTMCEKYGCGYIMIDESYQVEKLI